MSRRLWLPIVLCCGLAACGGEQYSDLRQFVKDSEKLPHGRIPPLPDVKPYEPFTYDAYNLIDPFKPRKIEPPKTQAGGGVQPDLARRKEPLEAYPLEGLSMVGTLEKGKTRYALVKTPERDIYQVRQGNHMGQNFGVVVGISDTDIKLKELMQDGAGDWSERSSTLNLLQADQKQEQKK
jgi:type IV pilus assembly protein PilP